MSLDIDFSNIISAPFQDKNWAEKIGIIALVLFSSYFLIFMAQFLATLVLSPFLAIIIASEELTLQSEILSSVLLSGGLITAFAAVTAPPALYLRGYINDHRKSLITGKTKSMPDHGKIFERLKLGLKIFIVKNFYKLFLLIIPIIVLVIIYSTSINSLGTGFDIGKITTLSISYIILGLIATLISLFLSLVSFVQHYIFLTTGSISKALNPFEISSIFPKSLLHILIDYGARLGLYILATVLISLSTCLRFITTPIVWALTISYYSYLQGEIMRSMQQKLRS